MHRAPAHETRSIHCEHNRRVTISKRELCTSFGTIIVVATRTRSVQSFLIAAAAGVAGIGRFHSALAPIGRDYGQENLVAAVRADGATNLSHSLTDVVGQHAACLAQVRNLRVGGPTENDDNGTR